MPTPAKGPRLGGGPAHERLMLANLATALFEHGRITTTETKARRLRPYAEKLVTFGKRGDLHARRQVLKVLRDKSVVHTLFAEIGPRYGTRPGGYTRIVKLGPRKGDNAPMALIELVEALTVGQSAVGEAERARGTSFAPSTAPTGATAEAAAELAGESPTAASVAGQVDEQIRTDVDSDVATGGDAGEPGQVDPGSAPVADTAADRPVGGSVPIAAQTSGAAPDPTDDEQTADVAPAVDSDVQEAASGDGPAQVEVGPGEDPGTTANQ